MESIRQITRYVARYNRHVEPSAMAVQVHHIKASVSGAPHYFAKTPWAMIDTTPDADDARLIAALGHSFGTEEEAQQYAISCAPHWHNASNEAVRDRLQDSIRWHGDFMGGCRLADALDISTDAMYRLVNGTAKATRKNAEAARNYHG